MRVGIGDVYALKNRQNILLTSCEGLWKKQKAISIDYIFQRIHQWKIFIQEKYAWIISDSLRLAWKTDTNVMLTHVCIIAINIAITVYTHQRQLNVL